MELRTYEHSEREVISERGTVAEIYDRYYRPILAHLRRLLSDPETAEDLCQETFIRAMRALERGHPDALSAWLYRIATNLAYDHLRRRRRVAFVALDDDPAESGSLEGETAEQEAVEQALAQLPAHYSAPLLMHSYDGRRIEEIAATLGWPVGTVKSRLFRARAMFRSVYAG